jgi:hypothetical protein
LELPIHHKLCGIGTIMWRKPRVKQSAIRIQTLKSALFAREY